MTISEAPNVLVLHLKRFSFGNMFAKVTKHIPFTTLLSLPTTQCNDTATDTANGTNNSANSAPVFSKSPKHIAIPIADSNAIEYDLTGIVVHHGYSTHSGHYISYVKVIAICCYCYCS